MKGSSHRRLLEALDLPGPALEPLSLYLDLLAEWSKTSNLTAARTPEKRVELLVKSVLPAQPWLQEGSLLDVGSGNGSPGLVLALLRPSLVTTLLEPRARRWAFLREAARCAAREDIVILRERHDQYRGSPAQDVTVRALALPLEELRPLAAEGGRLLVFGKAKAECEGWTKEPAPGLEREGILVFRRTCFT